MLLSYFISSNRMSVKHTISRTLISVPESENKLLHIQCVPEIFIVINRIRYDHAALGSSQRLPWRTNSEREINYASVVSTGNYFKTPANMIWIQCATAQNM